MSLHHFFQENCSHGLRQELKHARLFAVLFDLSTTVGRDSDYLGIAKLVNCELIDLCKDVLGGLQAIHHWHLHVHKYKTEGAVCAEALL